MENVCTWVRWVVSELQKEITDTATEAENCIDLLLPKPDFLFTESDFAEGCDVQDNTHHTPPSRRAFELSSQHSSHCSAAGPETKDSCSNGSRSAEQGDASPVAEKGCETNTNAKTTLSKPNDLLATKENDGDSTGESLLDSTQGPAQDPSQSNKDRESQMEEEEEEEDDFEAVDSDEAEERGMVQTHGLGSRNYNLQIEIDPDEVRLMETEDNRDLFRTLKDCSRLVSMRHLPQVIKWLEVGEGIFTDVHSMLTPSLP